jgi:hypothetical protein
MAYKISDYAAGQAHHEIRWLENKIEELQPKLQKRPRTIREINDLKRQIVDRQLIIKTYQEQS